MPSNIFLTAGCALLLSGVAHAVTSPEATSEALEHGFVPMHLADPKDLVNTTFYIDGKHVGTIPNLEHAQNIWNWNKAGIDDNEAYTEDNLAGQSELAEEHELLSQLPTEDDQSSTITKRDAPKNAMDVMGAWLKQHATTTARKAASAKQAHAHAQAQGKAVHKIGTLPKKPAAPATPAQVAARKKAAFASLQKVANSVKGLAALKGVKKQISVINDVKKVKAVAHSHHAKVEVVKNLKNFQDWSKKWCMKFTPLTYHDPNWKNPRCNFYHAKGVGSCNTMDPKIPYAVEGIAVLPGVDNDLGDMAKDRKEHKNIVPLPKYNPNA